MSTTKIEFAVQMTCDSCVETVRKSFENVEGVKGVDINLKTGTVVVDSNLSTQDVQTIFTSAGKKAVVKGYAGTQAGVAVLDTGSAFVQGVVRFIQLNNTCIIDGTVDGLKNGLYTLAVHECGDVSGGCDSVGDVFHPNEKHSATDRLYGSLGHISAENNGRATFRLEDDVLKLSDVIGRALVLSNLTNKKRLVCGIIARSSGLFENPKTICACDGVSIWDERKLPKAGL